MCRAKAVHLPVTQGSLETLSLLHSPDHGDQSQGLQTGGDLGGGTGRSPLGRLHPPLGPPAASCTLGVTHTLSTQPLLLVWVKDHLLPPGDITAPDPGPSMHLGSLPSVSL